VYGKAIDLATAATAEADAARGGQREASGCLL